MDQDPKWCEVMLMILVLAFAGEEAIPDCKETVRFLTAAHAQQEDF